MILNQKTKYIKIKTFKFLSKQSINKIKNRKNWKNWQRRRSNSWFSRTTKIKCNKSNHLRKIWKKKSFSMYKVFKLILNQNHHQAFSQDQTLRKCLKFTIQITVSPIQMFPLYPKEFNPFKIFLIILKFKIK
jgi:hypothetical protein